MVNVQPLSDGDPRRLGDYDVTGRLGEGGQGVVYLGSGSGGSAAIKLLHAQLIEDEPARARFVREVEVTKRVARFCTAQVLSAGTAQGRPYIVSEYVPGPSLHQQLREEGPRHGSALDRLAINTATALAAIHQAGVVHRDFKPGNVLMGPDGPVVIDFGIARALDTTGAMASAVSQVVGTPAFMAPEQLSEGPIGPPTDMFAWAVTMVFAASGVPAFGHRSIQQVINRILHEEPDLGALDGRLRPVVAACLNKDPSRRPTARSLMDELMGHHEAAISPAAHPPSAPAAPAGPAAGASSAWPGRSGRSGLAAAAAAARPADTDGAPDASRSDDPSSSAESASPVGMPGSDGWGAAAGSNSAAGVSRPDGSYLSDAPQGGEGGRPDSAGDRRQRGEAPSRRRAAGRRDLETGSGERDVTATGASSLPGRSPSGEAGFGTGGSPPGGSLLSDVPGPYGAGNSAGAAAHPSAGYPAGWGAGSGARAGAGTAEAATAHIPAGMAAGGWGAPGSPDTATTHPPAGRASVNSAGGAGRSDASGSNTRETATTRLPLDGSASAHPPAGTASANSPSGAGRSDATGSGTREAATMRLPLDGSASFAGLPDSAASGEAGTRRMPVSGPPSFGGYPGSPAPGPMAGPPARRKGRAVLIVAVVAAVLVALVAGISVLAASKDDGKGGKGGTAAAPPPSPKRAHHPVEHRTPSASHHPAASMPVKTNPYTPQRLCGGGYRVVDRHGLGGARVYLLYNSKAGANCVVTMVPRSSGKVPLSTSLAVKGGGRGSRSGAYPFYAGPIRLPARGKCVMWGGSSRTARWTSGWSHCASDRTA
ncbi:serine/threonine-protein kinase [Actinomadura sp. DC4]|uniref:serine/threonine-protein kinase n=1 Tax=Actinomadura sp. DC4 TaxID=3055069 RepID=UPI0025B03455|nr:serine/threonine-protein kinase [Actinomadura sp. DC4]MDN3353544.1 serine/threonine-protein kinase [Actinomadura sp. DC4]